MSSRPARRAVPLLVLLALAGCGGPVPTLPDAGGSTPAGPPRDTRPAVYDTGRSRIDNPLGWTFTTVAGHTAGGQQVARQDVGWEGHDPRTSPVRVEITQWPDGEPALTQSATDTMVRDRVRWLHDATPADLQRFHAALGHGCTTAPIFVSPPSLSATGGLRAADWSFDCTSTAGPIHGYVVEGFDGARTMRRLVVTTTAAYREAHQDEVLSTVLGFSVDPAAPAASDSSGDPTHPTPHPSRA